VSEREAPSPRTWEAVVSVREDVSLEDELLGRFAQQSGDRAIGVTDLVSLRRAFYRGVAPPVPIPPERQARLEEGRALHRALGARLSGEGTLEARVRRDGLVGRIDLLSDLPVEVKTASTLVEPSRLATERPEHVEQLAMYCALVDRPIGRLLTLVPGADGVSDAQVLDLAFRSTDRVSSEMRRRASLLRTAWAEGRVDELPRCPWYFRGCEFRDAKVCACTGEEPPVPTTVLDELTGTSVRTEIRDRILPILSEPVRPEESAPVGRYRDLLYPRRAYFERVAPEPVAAPPSSPAQGGTTLPSPKTPDLYARCTEALESGPAGEVARLVGRGNEPEEEVVGFRGRPYLVRTSRAWSRFRPNELVARAPQYALELGMRCAMTGTDTGTLVVGFERAGSDRERLQVLELRFGSLTPFSRWYRERANALARALRERTPDLLPACPQWMVADCPYRSDCGCGASGDRVTR